MSACHLFQIFFVSTKQLSPVYISLHITNCVILDSGLSQDIMLKPIESFWVWVYRILNKLHHCMQLQKSDITSSSCQGLHTCSKDSDRL